MLNTENDDLDKTAETGQKPVGLMTIETPLGQLAPDGIHGEVNQKECVKPAVWWFSFALTSNKKHGAAEITPMYKK